MELFEKKTDKAKNYLPYDGVVHYHGKLFTAEEAQEYFNKLFHNIAWQHDEALMFGKRIITKRKVAWYGEKPFEYTYSKIRKYALPWTNELLSLKNIVEQESGETFNSCLLNLYHSGAEGMAWHSDDETDLKKEGAIGSLSFGAKRNLPSNIKNPGKIDLILEPGSLLVMKGHTQTHWLHRLPPSKRIQAARVNLTFRTMID
ncbi:MAG: alpha-ketoglutarate-dependent dioxygenase AlkB [Microscillaceae bacterium]|nr:alpha-ketoglutarate-dependent dioxygenase AlkB [Microscillaceae bacterium]